MKGASKNSEPAHSQAPWALPHRGGSEWAGSLFYLVRNAALIQI